MDRAVYSPGRAGQGGDVGLDEVLAEADRQLTEQRAQADAYASRSGLMIAATALLVGLLGADAEFSPRNLTGVLWLIGGSAALGIVVQCMGRLLLGPSPSQLSRWMNKVTKEDLLSSKLTTVEANARALLRQEIAFLVQAASAIAGIVMIILSA